MGCWWGHRTALWICTSRCEERPLTRKNSATTIAEYSEVKKTQPWLSRPELKCCCTCYHIILYFPPLKSTPWLQVPHAIRCAQMRNLRIEVPVLVLPSLRYPDPQRSHPGKGITCASCYLCSCYLLPHSWYYQTTWWSLHHYPHTFNRSSSIMSHSPSYSLHSTHNPPLPFTGREIGEIDVGLHWMFTSGYAYIENVSYILLVHVNVLTPVPLKRTAFFLFVIRACSQLLVSLFKYYIAGWTPLLFTT
jgi:hypothetical protein